MIADSLYQFKISIGDTTSPVLAMHQNVNGPRIFIVIQAMYFLGILQMVMV